MRYIIDYENVGSNGLIGIDKLEKEGNVISLFYSVKNDRFPIDFLEMLTSGKCAKIEYFKATKCVPQNVDFRIGTYVGFLIGSKDESSKNGIYIVSNDKGYQNVRDFWAERDNKQIILCESIAEGLGIKTEAPVINEDTSSDLTDAETMPQETEAVIEAETVDETPVPYRERIKALYDEEKVPKKNGKVNEVTYKAFDNCKSVGDYHFQLVNELGRELGERCYNLTKELFEETCKKGKRTNRRR